MSLTVLPHTDAVGFCAAAAIVGMLRHATADLRGEELEEFVLAQFIEEMIDHLVGVIAANEVTNEL